jgi:hypothetical protein
MKQSQYQSLTVSTSSLLMLRSLRGTEKCSGHPVCVCVCVLWLWCNRVMVMVLQSYS